MLLISAAGQVTRDLQASVTRLMDAAARPGDINRLNRQILEGSRRIFYLLITHCVTNCARSLVCFSRQTTLAGCGVSRVDCRLLGRTLETLHQQEMKPASCLASNERLHIGELIIVPALPLCTLWQHCLLIFSFQICVLKGNHALLSCRYCVQRKLVISQARPKPAFAVLVFWFYSQRLKK
jgi:hypothetical protein